MCEPRAAGGDILHSTLAERASLCCIKECHRIDFLARKFPLVGGHCSGLQSKTRLATETAPPREQSDSKCRVGGDCHANSAIPRDSRIARLRACRPYRMA